MSTKTDINERDQLMRQRSNLLDDIELLKETLRGEVDVDIDEGDPDVVEREKSAVLLSALEARLASVEDALRAIDRGTYGTCERCGKPIPPERLEVRPDATMCVTCQTEFERLLKRGMTPPRPRWGYELDAEVEEE
ncbi:MAG: TraR/DksA C4-type zinc finger protein [Caldilineales bacterium]|nr:TraR/DksA C4-type zinc finger protein [Caldilineales bacterium]